MDAKKDGGWEMFEREKLVLRKKNHLQCILKNFATLNLLINITRGKIFSI